MKVVRPGVAFLRDNRQRRREQTFGQLSLYWDRLRNDEVWPELVGVLQQAADGRLAAPAVAPTAESVQAAPSA